MLHFAEHQLGLNALTAENDDQRKCARELKVRIILISPAL
jgi:hypothetical protein